MMCGDSGDRPAGHRSSSRHYTGYGQTVKKESFYHDSTRLAAIAMTEDTTECHY